MNPPMMGAWTIDVRDVRPFTIHGDLYYELQGLRTDPTPVSPGESAAVILRVPQHAAKAVPQPGDQLVVTFLMGQVTSVTTRN